MRHWPEVNQRGALVTEQQNGRGRKIILLSDGTGNSSGKLFKTNVWRLYAALDVSNAGQVAFYNNGVGTSAVKPLAVLGGAFGWGLKRNVLDLYTFLCRNYQPGDRIYGFGFSRGAFTIRVLINFVLSQGLVTNPESTDDLRRKAVRLYRRFRNERTRHYGVHSIARLLRDGFGWLGDCIMRGRKYGQIPTRKVPKIEFLGLWDTVDAYGLPVEELERGIDRYLWPLSLQDGALHEDIKKACHALSIDDQRKTFHPLLFDESGLDDKDHTDAERLTQVWFAGVHANVGGGYPDDSLSSITLRWMMYEAGKQGLSFSPQSVAEVNAKIAPYGPIYDSRAGVGAYYRYGPRHLDPPRDRQGACIPNPKIHETVIWRMVAGADAYAPLSLPNKLRIVIGPDNSDFEEQQARLQQAQPAPPASTPSEPNVLHFETYRDAVRAEGNLFGAPAGQNANDAKKRRAASEFGVLETPDDKTLALIWDTIWWRRVAYYSTLVVTLVLLTWVISEDVVRWLEPSLDSDEAFKPFASKLADLIAMFIPQAFVQYLSVLRDYPIFTLGLVGTNVGCLMWGARLDRLIHDRALAAWSKPWKEARFEAFRTSLRARFVTMFLLAFLPVILGLLSLVAYFVDGSAFAVLLLLLAIFFFLIAAPILAWGFSLFRIWRRGEEVRTELRGVALWFAYKLRSSSWLAAVHRWTMQGIVPAVFALTVFMTGLYLVNRTAIIAFGALGWMCESNFATDIGEPKTIDFETKNMCLQSHARVRKGNSYRIEVTEVKDWADGGIANVGPGGFQTPWRDAPLMLLGAPMRRVTGEPWFQLHVRIGDTGDTIYTVGASGSTIKAEKDGELFFFVNDAVIGIPRLFDHFYKNNRGSAKITVKKL